MKVIKSMDTTDAILTYSNIEENEYPQWVSGTSYSLAQRVIYQHKIYEAIIATNGTTPPNVNATQWAFVDATNRYRMFDSVISNISSRVGSIHITLTPMDVVEGIVLLNIVAAQVQVVITDPLLGVIYDKTQTMAELSEINDYYTYFFSNVQLNKETALFLDLPISPTAKIDIYVDNGSGTASIGEVVYGSLKYIGRTNYGTGIGIKSYSRKETSEFGKTTVVKRKNSKYADYDLDIDNYMLADVQRFFADIDSIPCVFVGHEEKDELIVYGFYSDFKATISFVTVSKCNLRVEGLV